MKRKVLWAIRVLEYYHYLTKQQAASLLQHASSDAQLPDGDDDDAPGMPDNDNDAGSTGEIPGIPPGGGD